MGFGYRSTFQLIDKGNIEVFGPSGIAFNLQLLAAQFSKHQSGFVSNYALNFMLAVLLVVYFALLSVSGLGVVFSDGAFAVILFAYVSLCSVF